MRFQYTIRELYSRSVRALNDPYGSNELNTFLTDRYNAGVLDNPPSLSSIKNLFREQPTYSNTSIFMLLSMQINTIKVKCSVHSLISVSARLRHCGNPALHSEKAPRKMEKGPI